MSAPFHLTGMGRKAIESDLPKLIGALERIAVALETIAAARWPDPKPESPTPPTPEEPK